MRKEILFAILFGITIGGIITYGVYRANQAIINKATGNNPQVLEIPSPTPKTNTDISLAILNPEDNVVTGQNTISIQGKTVAEAIITISSEDQDFILESDTNGLFTQEIELIKGANIIKIFASDGNVLSPEKIINIVYSTDIDLETAQ